MTYVPYVSRSKKSMLFVLSTTRVTNSRFFKRQNTVWRRRQTPDGVVFTTRETIDLDGLIVRKKTKQETSYNPGKLYVSLLKACDHLPEPEETAWQIKITVEGKITTKLDSEFNITSRDIAEIAIDTLKLFNTTAYVKYASYQPTIVSARKLVSTIR